jgi:iron transport multicopper oxidase
MINDPPPPPPDLNMHYLVEFHSDTYGVNRAYVNNATFPGLTTEQLYKPVLFDYLQSGGGPLKEQSFYAPGSWINGSGTEPFVLPFNRVIDIHIVNTDGGEHPIHFHGHSFWIMETSEFSGNAVIRDVVSVPALGWARIRFVSDNPGVWVFHCHIDWHVAVGFVVVVIEAPSMLNSNTYINAVTESQLKACA